MFKRILPFLLLVGCAEPLVHQRALGTLHTQITQQCKATPATCAVVNPCAEGLRGAMAASQGVSAAITQGDDELEMSRMASALVSEGTARGVCVVALQPLKRSK